MINILLEDFDITAPWLYDALKTYILPHFAVAVVAFSFNDRRIRSQEDWNTLYAKGQGKYYAGIVERFAAFGIPEEQVVFLNYFADTKESAAEKIRRADLVYFLGGLPDRMMERIREFELYDLLAEHKGVMMGYSAGALIQLAEYHLAPDEDYPEFGYYRGFPYLNDFYLQVHYEGNAGQEAAIRRVLDERRKPVYAPVSRAGGLISAHGKITLLGDVQVFGGSYEKEGKKDVK